MATLRFSFGTMGSGKSGGPGARPGKAMLKRSATPPKPRALDSAGAELKFPVAMKSVNLPAGATPFFVHLAIGFGLLMIAAVVFVVAMPSRRSSLRRAA